MNNRLYGFWEVPLCDAERQALLKYYGNNAEIKPRTVYGSDEVRQGDLFIKNFRGYRPILPILEAYGGRRATVTGLYLDKFRLVKMEEGIWRIEKYWFDQMATANNTYQGWEPIAAIVKLANGNFVIGSKDGEVTYSSLEAMNTKLSERTNLTLKES